MHYKGRDGYLHPAVRISQTDKVRKKYFSMASLYLYFKKWKNEQIHIYVSNFLESVWKYAGNY